MGMIVKFVSNEALFNRVILRTCMVMGVLGVMLIFSLLWLAISRHA